MIHCADTGLYCNFVICGRTREDVLDNVRDHMKDFHKKEFSKDLYEKARNAIREGDCGKEITTAGILLF
jgi:predicted small metal-binding protein